MITVKRVRGVNIAAWVNEDGFSQGRPFLAFVHGSGGDHNVWHRQYDELSSRYNILAVDLPGHGRSEGDAEEDVSTYADWMADIIIAFDFTRPILIGHSLGSAICLASAVTYGDLLSGIVCVGGGAVMPVNPMIFDLLQNDTTAALEMMAKFSVTKINRAMFRPFLLKGFAKSGPGVIARDLRACDRFDLTGTLPALSLPALIVCGEDDKMMPMGLSMELESLVSTGNLHLIGGAGHFSMLERPEDFNEALCVFAEGLL